jgi:hypothetical protein
MVRFTAVIGDFFWHRGQDLRDFISGQSSHIDDDASTIATIDDTARPTTAHDRSMAAIQALREEDGKTHPLTTVLWKISVFLIGFPLVSYGVVKWTGLLDSNGENSGTPVPNRWQQIAFQNFERVSSMDMSADGSIVAIGNAVEGCVQIYEARPSWIFLDEICDETSDLFGSAVSLSGSGSMLAVSGFTLDGARPGFVRAYQYTNANSEWLAIGQDMVGETHDDFFGKSIDLSDSGDILAVGAPGDAILLLAGKVDIYTFNATHWNLLGESPRSLDNPNSFGNSVSLSSSGNVVAIGAPSVASTGSIEVYRFVNQGWNRVSEPIQGQFANETLGHSVSVAAVGDTITVSGSSRSLQGTTNRVQVFGSTRSEAWAQIKADLLKSEADTIEVDISADGRLLAIGAHESSYLFSTKVPNVWASLNPLSMSGGKGVALSTTSQGIRIATSGSSDGSEFVALYEELA